MLKTINFEENLGFVKDRLPQKAYNDTEVKKLREDIKRQSMNELYSEK